MTPDEGAAPTAAVGANSGPGDASAISGAGRALHATSPPLPIRKANKGDRSGYHDNTLDNEAKRSGWMDGVHNEA